MSQDFNDLESGVTTFGELYAIINANQDALRSIWSGSTFPTNPTDPQFCFRTDQDRLYVYRVDTWEDITEFMPEFVALATEVANARGLAASLKAFLDVAHNTDGSLKGDAPAGAWWTEETDLIGRIDAVSFNLTGDKTHIYTARRAIKLTQDGVTTYGYVVSSSESAGETTVVVDITVTADLESVEYGQEVSNAPELPELGEMAEKDFATEQEAIDATATDKGMSPYTSRKALTSFLQSTADQVIGIALVTTGGGAGTWARIDRDGNYLVHSAFNFGGEFYRYHSIYAAIAEQIIDDQVMIKIPKFFAKNGLGPAGSDAEGKPCYWISPEDEAGFHVAPAFMDSEVEIDQFWWGKYKARDAGGKLLSLPGGNPVVNTDLPGFQTLAEARNVGGVAGFLLTSFHQLCAIQRLMLIEMGSPDSQTIIASGHTSGSSAVAVEHSSEQAASWRGMFGLWGNVLQWMDGWKNTAANKIEVWDRLGNQTYVETIDNPNLTSSWRYAITLLDDSAAGFDLADAFLPATTDGTESNGTLAAGYYGNTGLRAYAHGGHWNYGSEAGLFSVNASNAPPHASTNVGGRLAKV